MPAAPEHRPAAEHRPVATDDVAAGRRSLLTVAVTTDPVGQPPRKLKKKTVDRVGKALRKAARAAAGAGLVVEVDLGALTAAAGRAATPESAGRAVTSAPAGRAVTSAPAGRTPEPRPSKRSAGEPAAAAPAGTSGRPVGKQMRRTRPVGTATAVLTPSSGAPASGKGPVGEDREDGSTSDTPARAPRAPRRSRPALRRTPARPPQP